ncbi:MAG: Hsp70 family protein [Blautia sp.]|nr:Hsp70 family protein [Blautia sp.]
MKTYVGIDLGTTNSVVCTYDGKETHVLKSPDQNDVTPSAIYVGENRGDVAQGFVDCDGASCRGVSGRGAAQDGKENKRRKGLQHPRYGKPCMCFYGLLFSADPEHSKIYNCYR